MSISPVLRYRDARAAIAFLERAFGFEPKSVHAADDGTVEHAELSGFGGIVLLGDEPEGGDPRLGPHAGQSWIYVSAEDPDAVYRRAAAAGAEILTEPADTDDGSRDVAVRDPEGNLWSFGTYAPGAPNAR